MDLTLSPEQLMLKQSIAEFLRREATPDQIARQYQHGDGYDPALLARAAEIGWLDMLVPPEYGGSGASLMDCGVAFEEFGRGPLPAPLFSAGVLVPQIVLAGGSEEQRARWLPAMARGELIGALAACDSGLGWGPELVETRLTPTGDGYRLDGTKAFVHDGAAANVLLCAARDPETQAISLVLVDRARPGVSVRPHGRLLPSIAEVRFDGVQVPRSDVLGDLGSGWAAIEQALLRAIPILCAFQVGACQQIFDFTVQYTRDRVAFGQPIGRFQRVQDHVVELASHMDAARWVTYETLWKLDTGQPAEAAVHEAKAVASEAYYWVVNYSHMVHAGPGTAMDYPLMAHHVVSRAQYQFLGNPLYHKRRMMDALYPRERAVS